MSPANHKSPHCSPRLDTSVAMVPDKESDVKNLMDFIRHNQGGIQRENTEMRIYSKLPDIGCSTITPRNHDNAFPTTQNQSLDTIKPIHQQRRSSDISDIINPLGFNDSKPIARPAGHAPGLRLKTMRQLPPLRRHSMSEPLQFDRPHNPPPDE